VKTCTQCAMRYPNDTTHCFVDGTELVQLPDPRVGTLLAGRYVVEEVVGEGGMATVYRARHKMVDRTVAVKVMNPLLASDAVVRERFRREAKSAQKLAHPNIIEIFDQGDTEDGTCFIVMELLHGESLSAVVQRGPLDVDRAIHIMIQIARGIARAHDLDIIHRDLKPENIFLCRRDDGRDLVKLLDFGIARSHHDSRLTGQGELFGTPQYMAPERILGSESGGSSDIYALGVVFFEMITGELPFDAPDVASFFVKHMNEAPPAPRTRNPRVPEALERLVLRMLAKTPAERPVDAHRIHQDLLDIVADREIAAPPTTGQEAPPSSHAPVTLAAGAGDHWARRIFVLEQMLTRAFGAKQRAPGELTELLDEVNRVVRQVVDHRTQALDEQSVLEQIEVRGRDKRAQLGVAVDELGVDVSRAKEELRAAREAFRRAEDDAAMARSLFEAVQRDVVYWEGRSGFVEPSTDLANAYRTAARVVDSWIDKRNAELETIKGVEAAEQVTGDLDFQLRELRTALSSHEQELDEARARCQERISARESDAEALEAQLAELTTRFCEPLRARPELEPLFRELETTEAAA
jgi:eukaryotic-like serine/threonine-protein kinase